MSKWLAWIATAFAFCTLAPPASADAVVTLCHTDTETGSGVNLATALKTSGVITFNCGAAATIAVTQSYTITNDTSINGGKTITLAYNSLGASAAFVVQGVVFELTGLHLTLSNAAGSNVSFLYGEGTISISDASINGCSSAIRLGDRLGNNMGSRGTLTIKNTLISNSASPVYVAGENWSVSFEQVEFENNDASFNLAVGRLSSKNITVTGNRGADNFSVKDTAKIVGSNFLDGNGAKSSMRVQCLYESHKCQIQISNSKFLNNASVNGGALQLADGDVTLTGVIFENNSTSGDGGAIDFGPISSPRSLTINHGVFRGNSAGVHGGAIGFGDYAGGTPVVFTANAVDFANNRAAQTGGAISGNAQLLVNRGMFVGNTAGVAGGAIFLDIGEAGASQFSNTLIARNQAPKGGGFDGFNATFINSTIVDNVGGGLTFNDALPLGALKVSLKNTILARNAPQNCILTDQTASHLIDAGNNIQFPRRSCGLGPLVADPRLDPLYVPVSGGPAYGHGDEVTCEASPVSGRDLFNQHRPQGAICTIGAAEGMPANLVDSMVRTLGGSGIGQTAAAGTGGGTGGSSTSNPGDGGSGSGACGCNPSTGK